jgi:ATP/ADP translocase
MQILYSMATQRFSRATLFNIVIMTFMGWFVAFGLMYPSHETIHFHALAEDTLKTLPSGLAGAVGMVKPPASRHHACCLATQVDCVATPRI